METKLDRIPLVALLGHAHDALEADFNARMKASPYPDLSLAHSRNVLRHLGRDGCQRVAQLVERSGVSKQSLSLQVAHLERAGYVTSRPDPDDGRARLLSLTERGHDAQRLINRTLSAVDDKWRDNWGEATWTDTRALLAAVVEARHRDKSGC